MIMNISVVNKLWTLLLMLLEL